MARLTKDLKTMDKGFLAFILDFLFGYKPNKHYMRGPGPAWHAKRSSSQQQ